LRYVIEGIELKGGVGRKGIPPVEETCCRQAGYSEPTVLKAQSEGRAVKIA